MLQVRELELSYPDHQKSFQELVQRLVGFPASVILCIYSPFLNFASFLLAFGELDQALCQVPGSTLPSGQKGLLERVWR